MIFTSNIPIYLKRNSELAKVRPSKVFARFFHDLTGGALSPEEERQTFTAVEILQDIHRVFRKLNIKNLQSLSVDEFDYYKDIGENKDDMDNAFAKMKQERAGIVSPVFEHMYLGVKTEYSGLTLFLEVDIHRCHTPDEAPINLTITGTISDLQQKDNETIDELKSRVHAFFPDDASFNAKKQHYEQLFEAFSSNLLMALKQSLGIEDAMASRNTVVVRPGNKDRREFHEKNSHVYVHHSRDGGQEFLYLWLITDMMHTRNYHASDLVVHSDEGQLLAQIDNEGSLPAMGESLFNSDVALNKVEVPGHFQPNSMDAALLSDSDNNRSSFSAFSDSNHSDQSDGGGSGCGSSCGGGCGS